MIARLLALGSMLALPGAATAAGPAHSLQLSKVILDNSGGEVKGKLKVGTICLFSGGPIKLRDRKITQDHERFENLFAKTMKERGYAVVATDADLFAGADQSPKGDYLFGATVHLDQIDLCSSLKGEKGALSLNVEWKVYDRAQQKVVATVVTSGQAAQEKFSTDGLARLIDGAFVSSLRALSDKAEVQAIVGAPAASTSAAAVS